VGNVDCPIEVTGSVDLVPVALYSKKNSSSLPEHRLKRRIVMHRIALLLAVVSLLGPSACVAQSGWDVQIREWDVPTQGSRPHDPEVAPDGSLWYTGQYANKLGRLDPKTGQIKEYLLKTEKSGPHGLVADKQGNIWYTGNSAAHIGKLDPNTGEVVEYPMPDPAARDPHTAIFDKNGILYFTVQQGNFIGKLDPSKDPKSAVTLQKMSEANVRPYGIIIGQDGMPYFAMVGTNKIGRIDPKTLAVKEYVLPEGARVRRLSSGKDGYIYYADFARGYLGRFDPKVGKVEEWPSPGGTGSRPYGIAATNDGMIWYSESGVEPNTLVVFDPKKKTFEKWPIPSGGGVVRHMVATPDGKLYLANSGVNKVAIAEVRRK
jgi:virginiamycin B lyase